MLGALVGGRTRVVITGPAGTGKTILLQDVARVLREAGCSITPHRAPESGTDLPDNLVPATARHAVLIDEADRLPASALATIRGAEVGIVVLAGTEKLRERMPGCQQVVLHPLTRADARAYIDLWLAQERLSDTLLSEDAKTRLIERASGIPRVLASLLRNSAWFAADQGSTTVEPSHIDAASDLHDCLIGVEDPAGAVPARVASPGPLPVPADILRKPVPERLLNFPATVPFGPGATGAAASAVRGTALDRVAGVNPPMPANDPAPAMSARPLGPIKTGRTPAPGKEGQALSTVGLVSSMRKGARPRRGLRIGMIASIFACAAAAALVFVLEPGHDVPRQSALPVANGAAEPLGPGPLASPPQLAPGTQPADIVPSPPSPAGQLDATPVPAADSAPGADARGPAETPSVPAASAEADGEDETGLTATSSAEPPSPPGTSNVANSPAAAPDVQATSPDPGSAENDPSPGEVASPSSDAPVQTAAGLAASAPAHDRPKFTGPGAEALMERARELLALGDISGARLMYGRAADEGSAAAALALGRTFDPAALTAMHARVPANPATALEWYRRAALLGSTEAAAMIGDLQPPR